MVTLRHERRYSSTLKHEPVVYGSKRDSSALPGAQEATLRPSPPPAAECRPAGPDVALDFQFDVTVDGRQVRFLNIIDEHTREALATTPARSFTADATIAVLDQLIDGLGRRPNTSAWTTAPS